MVTGGRHRSSTELGTSSDLRGDAPARYTRATYQGDSRVVTVTHAHGGRGTSNYIAPGRQVSHTTDLPSWS